MAVRLIQSQLMPTLLLEPEGEMGTWGLDDHGRPEWTPPDPDQAAGKLPPGVLRVEVPDELVARYEHVTEQWSGLQRELSEVLAHAPEPPRDAGG